MGEESSLLFLWYEDTCMINGGIREKRFFGKGEQKQALFSPLAFFFLLSLSFFLFFPRGFRNCDDTAVLCTHVFLCFFRSSGFTFRKNHFFPILVCSPTVGVLAKMTTEDGFGIDFLGNASHWKALLLARAAVLVYAQSHGKKV